MVAFYSGRLKITALFQKKKKKKAILKFISVVASDEDVKRFS